MASEVLAHGKPTDVFYVANRRSLIDLLCDECQPGDLVITQGAGDVTLMGPALIAALQNRAKRDA